MDKKLLNNALNQVEQNESATSLTGSQQSQLGAKVLPDHWIAGLFKKLQARYGNRWHSAIEGIESFAIKEWAEVLAGISGEQVKLGIDSLPPSWPPTAMEFRNLCLGREMSYEGPSIAANSPMNQSHLMYAPRQEYMLEQKKTDQADAEGVEAPSGCDFEALRKSLFEK